jgi:pyruvate-formate lyase-activating enzyme
MKNAAYDDFWVEIHEHARARHLPLRVMFELTYRCNFNCRHCYVPKSWRRKKELNTAGIFTIIRQLEEAGCLYLGFTGGEILLRRDIWEILEFTRQQGMQTILYTNGSLIDEPAAKRIADSGVNKVDITLPGITAKVFDGVTGVNGSHQAVFSAINYLRRHKVNLGFKTCLLKANQGEIKAIQEYCSSINCAHRLDRSPSQRLDQLTASPAKPTKSFKCGGGITQCAITPAGRVKVCTGGEWPAIEISSKNKFFQIWEKLPKMIKDGKCYRPCPCGLGRLTEERCAMR